MRRLKYYQKPRLFIRSNYGCNWGRGGGGGVERRERERAFYPFYDSKQQGRRVPRDKGRMLDAPGLGTASQTGVAARQSRDSTDYSTGAISVHIYPTEFLRVPGIQTAPSTANRPPVDRPSIQRLSVLATDLFAATSRFIVPIACRVPLVDKLYLFSSLRRL